MNHSDNRPAMAAASFILAIVAIATFQIFFISLPCASVSIILALISRGDGKILPRAKAAIACAAVAAVLTTSITAYSVYTVMHDPQMMAEVQRVYQYYTDPSAAEDPSADSGKDAEDLVRSILSGEYRREKQKEAASGGSSAGSAPSGSSASGSADSSALAAQNGGSVI